MSLVSTLEKRIKELELLLPTIKDEELRSTKSYISFLKDEVKRLDKL